MLTNTRKKYIMEVLHLVPDDCYEIPILVRSCGRH